MMVGEGRDDLVSALLAMRREHPDWRFGQMVCNVAYMAREYEKGAVWEVEDIELIVAIEKHLASRNTRL